MKYKQFNRFYFSVKVDNHNILRHIYTLKKNNDSVLSYSTGDHDWAIQVNKLILEYCNNLNSMIKINYINGIIGHLAIYSGNTFICNSPSLHETMSGNEVIYRILPKYASLFKVIK